MGAWVHTSRVVLRSLLPPFTLFPISIYLIHNTLPPQARMGAGSATGLRALKSHAWLSGVDWAALSRHAAPAPTGMRERIYNYDGGGVVPLAATECEADTTWTHAF